MLQRVATATGSPHQVPHCTGAAIQSAPACCAAHRPVCEQVTQGAIRSVANSVFRHLHGMDLGFHLSRQVRGSCSRGEAAPPMLPRRVAARSSCGGLPARKPRRAR